MNLEGCSAVVTGGASGLGAATARLLASQGVKVAIFDMNAEKGEAMAAEIGGVFCNVNVTNDESVDAGFAKARAAIGQERILINCAGGSRPPIPVDAPESEWSEVMTLNFIRVRQLTHAALADMIKHKWGRIINITGKSEPDGLLAATPAKAAMHGWAKGLSREVGQHGITVNCIPPGRIMSEQIRRKYTPEFRAKQSKEEIPMGRYGEPEELACLAVFLASPVAGYITGAVMPVDGGLRRYAF